MLPRLGRAVIAAFQVGQPRFRQVGVVGKAAFLLPAAVIFKERGEVVGDVQCLAAQFQKGIEAAGLLPVQSGIGGVKGLARAFLRKHHGLFPGPALEGEGVQGVGFREGGRSFPLRGKGRAEALAHLFSGTAREGDGHDGRGWHAAFQQAHKAAYQRTRLACAGACQNQHRAGACLKGGALGRTEGLRQERRGFRGGSGGLPGEFSQRFGAFCGQRRFFLSLAVAEAAVGISFHRLAADDRHFRQQGRRVFRLVKKADGPVFAVVATLTYDLTGAHTAHGFAKLGPCAAEFGVGNGLQDVHFRAEAPQKASILFLHFLGLGAAMQKLAHDFRQGDERREVLARLGSFASVGKGQYAMQNAHGERLAADGANVAELHAFGRLEHDAAGPMPIKVIFAFFGEEFQRSRVARSAGLLMQGVENAVVAGRALEKRGFAGEVLAGMGVGAGDHEQMVEVAPAPVHIRVGGKAGLGGEDVGRKIFETLVKTVEAGLRAEEGEPRRPDMGGNHVGAGYLQHHRQQVFHVKAEDGAPVGLQVSYGVELGAEPVGTVEVGHIDKAVYLAHLAVLLVDRAYLGFQHELRSFELHAGKLGYLAGELVAGERLLQAVEAGVFVQFKAVAQFLPPYRVREVAGGKHVYALGPGPCRKVRNRQGFAGGAGEAGMDMQVSSEHGKLTGR